VGHSPCVGLQILIICPELSGWIINPEQRDLFPLQIRDRSLETPGLRVTKPQSSDNGGFGPTPALPRWGGSGTQIECLLSK